ncbi:MAG TPA: 3',5'-cyclic-nucleotide phosphodiesterase [Blastocatellia bacterium]|nr:3',5'-cyclic-nucleotide phosphodiesterase [Blastocatellia bacterium]
MKLQVLGCSGGQIPGLNLSSYLIDDTLAIDAGSLTCSLDFEAQKKIENVLITHAHLDHTMTLSTLSDNLFEHHDRPISIYGVSEAVQALASSFFNGLLWPDFTKLTTPDQPNPVLVLAEIDEEQPVEVGDFLVTAVRVSHSVPCAGYFIRKKMKTILLLGDTGPTEKVWRLAHTVADLSAIVIEASFPNRLQRIADSSGHLTPQSLAAELRKLNRPSVPVLVTHMKPQYRSEIIEELGQIEGFRLTILKDGDTFHF